MRDIINGIFYILRGGCAWRLLPADFPPWSTVYSYLRQWRIQGVWAQWNALLRERVRVKARRQPTPSAAVIDSQSVRSSAVAGPRGYDGNKKVNGRKRHLLVDTMGLVLGVCVHDADIQDRSGARLLLEPLLSAFPRLELVWADGGYTGNLSSWMRQTLHWRLEIVQHPWQGWQGTWLPVDAPPPPAMEKPKGFVVLKRRWVVERTFGWLGRSRRLSRDFEVLPATEEAFVYACMTRLMLKRLAGTSS
jgi:transposase